ncbi:MAG: acyltransferase family protein [Isosphaeraceae bacterium]
MASAEARMPSSGSESSSGRAPRPRREAAQARRGNPAEMGQALDTMRVVATLAVVIYHACLAYLTHPLRLTLWHVYDPNSHHPAVDVVVSFVNAFAMPLFFLAAGVSAPSGLESRGLSTFLNHRVKRLLRPLLVAGLTILPICYVLWGFGLMRRGLVDLNNILSWRFPPQVSWHLYGLGHLWFLEYLFLVCVLYGLAWKAVQVVRAKVNRPAGEGGLIDRALASPWRVIWLAIPTAAIFLIDTDTMIRVDNRMVPNGFRLLHYFYFFAAGGWLGRIPEPRKTLAPWGPIHLGLAAVLFAAIAPGLYRLAEAPLHGPERIALALGAALFPWLLVLGSLGVLMRLVESRGTVMRYLSESSFWIYLIHLPVIGLMQMLLLPVGWPVGLKVVLVASVAIAVSLVTYETSVRYSIVGELINGTRKRKARWGWRGLGTELGAVGVGAVLLGSVFGVLWYTSTIVFQDNYQRASGDLYRCARVSPSRLDSLLSDSGARTLIVFGGTDQKEWIEAQQSVCRARGVAYHQLSLRNDRLPNRETVSRLIQLLESNPRPVLFEGYRGIDHCGFAAGVAMLLEGESPERALKQFKAHYGQFGGPEYSYLGVVLIDYRNWLIARDGRHSAERFKDWARDAYLVQGEPFVPDPLRDRYEQVAIQPPQASAVR